MAGRTGLAGFRQIISTVALIVFASGTSIAADGNLCEVHNEAAPALCSYEPTTVGYTYDSDDSGFMDFKLSVRYQLFPDWLTRGQNYFFDHHVGYDSALYFAFTGRFGQYIKTRESSPVVEKLFNPKLFYRYWTDRTEENYLDFAFAHQSNGQSIDSPAQYQAALATAKNENEVKDQLSRGWDYWEIVWKKALYERPKPTAGPTDPRLSEVCKDVHEDISVKQACGKEFPNGIDKEEKKKTSVVSYVGYKYFLTHGPLEGFQENYNTWENDPQGKRLDRVSGFSILLKWIIRSEYKVAGRFETGVRDAFQFKTYRLELGGKVEQLPVSVWWQTGYNSDLAQYYKKVHSYGIQAEIGSF